MGWHDLPEAAGAPNNGGSDGMPDVDQEITPDWRDMEIWKVLVGADVDLEPELFDPTYVEAEENLPRQ